MDTHRRQLSVALSCLLGAPGLVGAQGADRWPSRQITIIVPFPPGASGEYLRLMAQRMSEKYGKPVVVENRPGATGVIGTQMVARAKPDGYTLLVGSNSSSVIAPMLLARKPYDALDDFEPVSMIADYPLVLVVNPGLPFKTVDELVVYARANPGKLNFASIGAGSATHLAAEWFKQRAQIDIVHVPHKGNSQAQTGVMAGDVQMWFDAPQGALQWVKAGRLRALAVTGPQRLPGYPDTPTMREAGIDDFEVRVWLGMFAPKGTPKAVIEELQREVARLSVSDEVKAMIELGGAARAIGSDAQTLATYIRRETKDWQSLVDTLGLKGE